MAGLPGIRPPVTLRELTPTVRTLITQTTISGNSQLNHALHNGTRVLASDHGVLNGKEYVVALTDTLPGIGGPNLVALSVDNPDKPVLMLNMSLPATVAFKQFDRELDLIKEALLDAFKHYVAQGINRGGSGEPQFAKLPSGPTPTRMLHALKEATCNCTLPIDFNTPENLLLTPNHKPYLKERARLEPYPEMLHSLVALEQNLAPFGTRPTLDVHEAHGPDFKGIGFVSGIANTDKLPTSMHWDYVVFQSARVFPGRSTPLQTMLIKDVSGRDKSEPEGTPYETLGVLMVKNSNLLGKLMMKSGTDTLESLRKDMIGHVSPQTLELLLPQKPLAPMTVEQAVQALTIANRELTAYSAAKDKHSSLESHNPVLAFDSGLPASLRTVREARAIG